MPTYDDIVLAASRQESVVVTIPNFEWLGQHRSRISRQLEMTGLHFVWRKTTLIVEEDTTIIFVSRAVQGWEHRTRGYRTVIYEE